ncbi:TPA: hypothetical protein I8W52_003335, partial [Morganella morganii]|nr:hypothetical protein [Morganella morganii]
MRYPRSSGEFFHYPEFDWDDYLSFQLWDGPDVMVIEFVIPGEQAARITEMIYNHGMAGSFSCAKTVFKILKESGGIFNVLEETPVLKENPWQLREKLLGIHYPEYGGVISGAIKNKSLIMYLSFSISVVFYYLEMVHAFFFRIYSHAANN